mgnify:CR=1 FL=1
MLGLGCTSLGSEDGKIRLYSNKTLTQVWEFGVKKTTGLGLMSWAEQGALVFVVERGPSFWVGGTGSGVCRRKGGGTPHGTATR